MSNYRLLSDAILDGSRLRGQCRLAYYDTDGRTCALGAAIHAVTGEPSAAIWQIVEPFGHILTQLAGCPVDGCVYDCGFPVSVIIPHLNDEHEWSRERIAGFVATIEERLGLVEIISDEPNAEQHSTMCDGEAALLSKVGESVIVSS